MGQVQRYNHTKRLLKDDPGSYEDWTLREIPPIYLDDNGTPRTVNRGVKVHMIAQKHLFAGDSIDVVAEHYGITLADVHAALAYYYDNLDHFRQREQELAPLIDEAKHYTADLNAHIKQRMQQQDDESSGC